MSTRISTQLASSLSPHFQTIPTELALDGSLGIGITGIKGVQSGFSESHFHCAKKKKKKLAVAKDITPAQSLQNGRHYRHAESSDSLHAHIIIYTVASLAEIMILSL